MLNFFKQKDIPKGVRILTYATSVRWVGWGFAESLIPVFLFSFAHTYAATGLLRSVFDIAFILALPVVGMAADRFLGSTLILIGLGLYLVVGSTYFLAGVTGLALFVVIARFTNGISYALDTLGRETYVRRHTPKKKLATVFGYFDTVANFWWIIAAVAGIFLIRYFSIHFLLFLVVPTSLIAFWIVWRFRKTEKNPAVDTDRRSLRRAYIEMAGEMRVWGRELRLVAMFNFFIAFASSAVGFFLPIESFVQNGNLNQAILIGILVTAPTLFGWLLGKWFDRRGIAIFSYGLLAFGILLGSLALFDASLVKLVVAFGAGIILELLSVGSNELITVYANPRHFGRVGGVMRTIFDTGGMAGPLVVGILLDWQGAHISFLSLAILMFLLAAVFSVVKRSGLASVPAVVQERYHHKIHQRR